MSEDWLAAFKPAEPRFERQPIRGREPGAGGKADYERSHLADKGTFSDSVVQTGEATQERIAGVSTTANQRDR